MIDGSSGGCVRMPYSNSPAAATAAAATAAAADVLPDIASVRRTQRPFRPSFLRSFFALPSLSPSSPTSMSHGLFAIQYHSQTNYALGNTACVCRYVRVRAYTSLDIMCVDVYVGVCTLYMCLDACVMFRCICVYVCVSVYRCMCRCVCVRVYVCLCRPISACVCSTVCVGPNVHGRKPRDPGGRPPKFEVG